MTNKRELLAKLLSGQIKPNEVKIPCNLTPCVQVLKDGKEVNEDAEYEFNLPDKGRVMVKWKDIDTVITPFYDGGPMLKNIKMVIRVVQPQTPMD